MVNDDSSSPPSRSGTGELQPPEDISVYTISHGEHSPDDTLILWQGNGWDPEEAWFQACEDDIVSLSEVE